MASIFLSYSRDDRVSAEALARVLERAGHEVWWDRHIESGSEFADDIEAALDRADLVLVAWSKSAAKSPWVRDEAAIGRDSGRLLPLLIDGSLPPIGFRQLQSLDLSKWNKRDKHAGTAALLSAVDARLKRKAIAFAAPRPKTKRRWSPRLLLEPGRRWWAAAAALVLIILMAGAAFLLLRPGAQAEPASLAVLPFKNLSAGDPYFAEGVAEEILTQLAHEPQFKVAGRTSSALFKDAADVRDVGRRLDVAYVLEGSVRSAGDQVRVDVSLVETTKGMRLWSQNFRGNINDIFTIQDQIGQHVASHLRRQLIRSAGASGTMRTRGDVYALYLTARGLIRDREPAKLQTAVKLLRQAVQLDPNYAPAWAQLADAARLDRGLSGGDLQIDKFRQEVLGYARHALQLAPQSAEANRVMGGVLSIFDDPKLAPRIKAYFEKSARLDPSDAETWNALAQMYYHEGDYPRSLDAWRRAIAIDPLWWRVTWGGSDLAWKMGYRDEADAIQRRVIRDGLPNPYSAYMARGSLAFRRGDFSTSHKLTKAALAVADPSRSFFPKMALSLELRSLGYFEQARKDYLFYDVDDDTWRMWLGQAPSPQTVADLTANTEPFDVWFDEIGVSFLLRTLVRTGRSAEAVKLFDRRFKSLDDAVSNYSSGHMFFIEDATVIALALRDVGRRADSDRLLALTDAAARKTFSRGRVPYRYYFAYSKLLAVMGRRGEAIDALRRAVNLGWFYSIDQDSFRDIADEPTYRELVSDPRFQSIRVYFATHLERERQELGPVGA